MNFTPVKPRLNWGNGCFFYLFTYVTDIFTKQKIVFANLLEFQFVERIHLISGDILNVSSI